MQTTVVWTITTSDNKAMPSSIRNHHTRNFTFSSKGMYLIMSPFHTCQRKPKQGTSPFASRIWASIYRVSGEECARLREGVPYVKVYRYNPKHLCPKLNGYGDYGQRKVWSSCGSTHCTCQLTILSISVLECGVI